jgi:putative ABC transport system permease protein
VDWREIQKRRPITMENVLAVRERVESVDLVGAEYWKWGTTVRYKNQTTNPNIIVCGGTPEYPANNTHYVEYGRNISNQDLRLSRHHAVIGHALAQTLFPFVDPVEKLVKIDGHRFRVVGVFQAKHSAMGANFDNYVLKPITVFTQLYGNQGRGGFERSINMTVNARSPELLRDAIEETRAVVRANRGVKPGQPDDFYVFTNDSQIRNFNQATSGVRIGAFVIGIIALIVAGVGIMNIMLVSVSERTREIGIRKSLGARRRDILWQFLLEAVVLCNIGGLGGVLVGFIIGNVVATQMTQFGTNIPWDWGIIGLLFCTAVGLVFGIWPAVKAARLTPVAALSYE